jgi:hypothetical protein
MRAEIIKAIRAQYPRSDDQASTPCFVVFEGKGNKTSLKV